MKRKVGLITIHGILNYGSALQTLATVETVRKFGFECGIIDYLYPTDYHKNFAPYYQRKKAELISKEGLYTKLMRRFLNWWLNDDINLKKELFQKFLRQNVKFTRPYLSADELQNEPPVFDIYLSGSDQVWNPLYCHDDTSFLLSFAPDDGLKISFSSSFGSSEFLANYFNSYKYFLNRYQAISVREESGKNIVREMTGNEPDTTLDPTLILTSQEWNLHSLPYRIVSKPYLLCYLLGYSFNPFPYVYELISYIQKTTGWDVVYIGGDPLNSLKRRSRVFPNAGPAEFLSLYRDAEFVITTSLHGTAFAINYKKPFFSIVNNENTLDDRQLNLAKMLGLEKRVIRKGSKFPSSDQFGLDYCFPDQCLEEERRKSLVYIEKALNFKMGS